MKPKKKSNNSPPPQSSGNESKQEGILLRTGGPSKATGFGELNAIFADYEKKFEVLKDKIDDTKQTNIETLAIFVALFTFVSIEFQLARSFDYLQFLHFSVFFGGLLIGFVLILDCLIHKELTLKFIIIMLLALAGIIFGFLYLREARVIVLPQSKNLDVEKINIEEVKKDPLQ